MSARVATATTSTSPSDVLDTATTLDVLREGELEVLGRIVGSSNNALFVTATRICPDPEPAQVIEAV